MKTDKPVNPGGNFILDASIAVKWFSRETDSNKAWEVLERIHKREVLALAPALIVYEVANALWKGKKVPKENLLEVVNNLFSWPIEIIELDESLAKTAVEIMAQHNLTFYDAVYGALAKLLDLPLLTANPKDHGKIKEIQILGLK